MVHSVQIRNIQIGNLIPKRILLIEAEWRYVSVNQPSLVQIMACRLVGAKP